MARLTSLLLVLGGLTMACASTKIHRVPRPDDYDLSTNCSGSVDAPCKNEIQRAADGVKGVRYYLPRPYVVVKQEFPVSGGTYFASGVLHGDNRIVRVDAAAEGVSALFPSLEVPVAGTKRSDVASEIPGSVVTTLQGGDDEEQADGEETDEEAQNPEGEGGDEAQSEDAADDGEGGSEGESDESDCEAETDANTETKQVSEAKATVSGDPTTDPLIRVSPLYDILLLPDFSQQYAIEVKAGLFKAAAEIGLENGWMAEKVTVSIDNSQLGSFIVESAQKLVDAGLTAAFPAKAAVDAASAQPDTDATELQSEEEGMRVLLRIDTVELAAPGIYPILKAAEQHCGDEIVCPPRVDFRTRQQTVVSLALEKGPAESDQVEGEPGSDPLAEDTAGNVP